MQLCRTCTRGPRLEYINYQHLTPYIYAYKTARASACCIHHLSGLDSIVHTDKERYHAASPSPSDESGLQALQGEAGPIRSAPLLPAHRSINSRALHMSIHMSIHTYICIQTAQSKCHFPPFLFQNPHSCTRATTVSPTHTHTSYARSRGRSAVVCANGRARGRRRTT
jgi:hypothetical protein